jgi:hypothetical protein
VRARYFEPADRVKPDGSVRFALDILNRLAGYSTSYSGCARGVGIVAQS